MSRRYSGSPLLRYVGSQVKHYRQARGLDQKELAGLVSYSAETVGSIEQGRRPPMPPFLTKADEVLDAKGALLLAIPHIERLRFPDFFVEFALAEASAVTLYSYEALVIPGLLQTERYARAVLAGYCPPLDEQELEVRVTARLERQALLSRRPLPVLGFVIEESAIRRPLGGRAVLKEQLDQLARCARLNHVSVQIMPADCEQHAGTDGSLVLLETSDQERVAYIEGQGVSQWVSGVKEVSTIEQRYGIIRAQALTTRDSLALIEQVAGEL